MANISDYIDWRGDVSFNAAPFNRIDALILCQITYLNFTGLLPDSDFSVSLTLKELADKFKALKDYKKRADVGVLINKNTASFFLKAAESVRFRDVKITGFCSKIDLSIEEQFAAATYLLPDSTCYICYRGTDDSIVGWKEDFNLAIEEEVPAQKDAVEYLEKAGENISGKIRIGGHSKGGNLAIYASAYCSKKVRDRILKIYNNDGPGFYEERIHSEEFKAIEERINSYYPQFSIVGMLFYHSGIQNFVESDEQGVMQHDPFSWHLKGVDFVRLPKNDYASRFFHQTFNEWIVKLSPTEREVFVDTVFGILESTDARTNSEIEANLAKNSVKIIKAINKLDPEMKKMCEKTIREFFLAGHSQLKKFDVKIRGKIKEKGKKLLAKSEFGK